MCYFHTTSKNANKTRAHKTGYAQTLIDLCDV